MMDITNMTLTELQQMVTSLHEEIDKRKAQERERVIEELSALARARGFTLADLLATITPGGATGNSAEARKYPILPPRRPPAPIKYRHPFQKDLTWTGRGNTPRWVHAWLAEGNAMRSLEVKNGEAKTIELSKSEGESSNQRNGMTKTSVFSGALSNA